MNMRIRRVAIYARVSTIDKQTYDRQVNDLTPVIQIHGYEKNQIEVFGENISGYKTKEERPEFRRLLDIIENDPSYFSCIYVTEISRLGRNPKEARETVDYLISLNIPIYVKTIGQKTINEDGSRNTIMSIILQVLMEFAHLEAEQMKERSKSGLLSSARKGRAGGGASLAFGYKKDENKMLVTDEEEAKVVREIFELYRKGNGAKLIAGILNNKGIKTRYNREFAGKTINFAIAKEADKIKWVDGTVLGILTNPLYKGHRRYKGEILTNIPNIVSEEVYDECEAIRKGRAKRNNLTTYTYLLKDLMTCGCCGRNYYARYKPTPEGDKVYVCSSAVISGERCPNKGINIMLLETAIFNELVMSDRVLKYISQTKEIKIQLEQDIAYLKNKIDIDKSRLASTRNRKENLLELRLDNGISPERFKEKDNEIDNQLVNIEKRLKLLKKEMSDKKILVNKHTDDGATKKMLLESANNRHELRAIFKQLIHKVIINDLTTKLSLATIYIKIDGVVLETTLKIVIDKISIRKKELRYIPMLDIDNDVRYDKDILLSDKEQIIEEIDDYVNQNGWVNVKSLLLVEPEKQ